MKTSLVRFNNSEGLPLAGELDLPGHTPPRVFCVFAHVFTGSKDLSAAVHISRALCAAGIGVLRFDFTGLGDSAGDFSDSNFSSNVSDIQAAAEYLSEHHQAPQLLVGHSLGGTATLKAASLIESCRAVVSIGSPADPEHVLHLLDDGMAEIEARGQARVTLAGRHFCIRKQFVDDVRAQDWKDWLRGLQQPLLILHSPVDEIVEVHNAALIYKLAPHPKSFVSLDDANHLLTHRRDAQYAGNLIATWVAHYLHLDSASEAKPATLSEQNAVIAHIDGGGHFRTELQAAGHTLLADEPESAGGENAGPSPYDLLGAALGACTVMTLRMYADQKQWPLEAATARVTHRKVHADDCAGCESTTGKIDEFSRELRLQGALDDTQRARLLEIANRCPVHRTLEGEIKVHTELVAGEAANQQIPSPSMGEG